jgi:hypothetical protein
MWDKETDFPRREAMPGFSRVWRSALCRVKFVARLAILTDKLLLPPRKPPMRKGADLLVAALENEDIERILGVPGEENLAVVEVLRGSKIELVLTRRTRPDPA